MPTPRTSATGIPGTRIGIRPTWPETAFQANLGGLRLDDAESEIEEWRRRSAEACVPWMIPVDEPQKIENDKTDVNNGYPHGRMSFLWPIYLSGGGGFEWYVQQDGGGHSFDQQIDDFNQMDVALQWTGHALGFLETLPLLFMEPRRDLAGSSAGGTTHCLAQPGGVYALYNREGGAFTLENGLLTLTHLFMRLVAAHSATL